MGFFILRLNGYRHYFFCEDRWSSRYFFLPDHSIDVLGNVRRNVEEKALHRMGGWDCCCDFRVGLFLPSVVTFLGLALIIAALIKKFKPARA